MSTGRRGRKRSLRVTPGAALLAVVVTALLLYLTVPVRAYLAQRDRLTRLEVEAELLERENRSLRSEASLLRDDEHVELLARRCLGMVRPGEIAFVVVPKDSPPTRPLC